MIDFGRPDEEDEADFEFDKDQPALYTNLTTHKVQLLQEICWTVSLPLDRQARITDGQRSF